MADSDLVTEGQINALIAVIAAQNKALADGLLGRPMIPRPPSGSYLLPWQVLASTGAAPTSGRATFIPIDVDNLSVNAIGCYCSTAAVAGTYTVTLGVYADNGSGSGPDLSNLIASGTITPTSTGNKWATITTQTFNGRYWLAFLYYQTVAPSTVPQFFCANNTVNNTVGVNSGNNIGAAVRGLALTGQTALPSSGSPSISGSSDIICCALRAA